MVFGSAVPSAGGTLTPQDFLELANFHLENAFSANNLSIALELCRHAEDSLSKAKKTAKNAHNQAVVQGVVYAYIGLGKLLESRGHVDGAQAIFKKAEKLGYVANCSWVVRVTPELRARRSIALTFLLFVFCVTFVHANLIQRKHQQSRSTYKQLPSQYHRADTRRDIPSRSRRAPKCWPIRIISS